MTLAEATWDQTVTQAAQADQRAAAAEARAEDACAEIARVREDAGRELDQLRADVRGGDVVPLVLNAPEHQGETRYGMSLVVSRID